MTLAALACMALLPLLAPAAALLLLTVAAVRAAQRADPVPQTGARPRVAVLVPAHDESVHLLPTIECLRRELAPGDRLLVVADNCSDDTAALARAAGVEVIERRDTTRRGKGYALAYGVEHLRAAPPDVVLVVDADCELSPGAVAAACGACHASGHPVQMLDLMAAPAGAGLRLRVLEFALRMKNLVRPLGSFRLGNACHLMGTGMALPWTLIASAELATGHVAEDMQLGIELTLAGHAPRFFAGARVSSRFADNHGTVRTQKTRWEHGHLAAMSLQLPALMAAALRRRERACAVLALDLMVPPLALYVLVLGGTLLALALASRVWPALIPATLLALVAMAGVALAVGLGWMRFGRDLLTPRELLFLPWYALWKLPVYLAYFVGRRSGWVRTARTT